MKFTELDDLIPYARMGKEKVLRMNPYPSITLAMPGRHAEETTPKGGDYVVMVTDYGIGWGEHQFKHDDIFLDLDQKTKYDIKEAQRFVKFYQAVVLGASPLEFDGGIEMFIGIGVNPYIFLKATQCLAVAEYRRYARFEAKVGGRYLPLRFASGIVEERWSASDAISLQKKGRPGVEMLEKQNGVPNLTKRLFEHLEKNEV